MLCLFYQWLCFNFEFGSATLKLRTEQFAPLKRQWKWFRSQPPSFVGARAFEVRFHMLRFGFFGAKLRNLQLTMYLQCILENAALAAKCKFGWSEILKEAVHLTLLSLLNIDSFSREVPTWIPLTLVKCGMHHYKHGCSKRSWRGLPLKQC